MFANIEWIFFDMGSTLIDETEAYRRRFETLAELSGKNYDDVVKFAEELYAEHYKGDTEAAKRLGVKCPSWFVDEEKPYPCTRDCLRKLRKKYKIGVIANQISGSQSRLEKFGIAEYIDVIAASAEEGVSKPDKRLFEIALNSASCRAENSVMVGDRIDNDIVPAKKLGMKTVWVKQGFGKFWKIDNEDQQPDLTVDTLADICEYL